MIINGNIAATDLKCWVTGSVLDLFSVCMTCSLFIKEDKSWQKYIKITRENLYQRYSACGKFVWNWYSHPLSSVLFKNSTHRLSNQNAAFSYVILLNYFVFFTVSLLLPEEGMENMLDLCWYISCWCFWSVEAKCNQSQNPILWQVKHFLID